MVSRLREAGDLCYKKKKKHKKHSIKKDDIAGNDGTTGNIETVIKDPIVTEGKTNEQPISMEKPQDSLDIK